VIVRVDATSPVPVFEQLREQIARLIVAGALAPGDRLPALRDLAGDLGIARGTVNRVYDALARDGLVETRGRNGTVVLALPVPSRTATGPSAPARGDDVDADLAGAADTFVVVVRQLGLPDDAAHAALDAALRRLDGA
jgi:GntR family transcriptional regulator